MAKGRGADFTLPDFQGGQGGAFGFGCQALGDANGQSSKQGTYQWYDGMSKIVKSHTFKWGVEYRDVYSNNYTDFVSRGTFTFNVFTANSIPTLQNLNTGVDTNLLEDTVGALLGLVNSQTQTQFFNPSSTALPTTNSISSSTRSVLLAGQLESKVEPHHHLRSSLGVVRRPLREECLAVQSFPGLQRPRAVHVPTRRTRHRARAFQQLLQKL